MPSEGTGKILGVMYGLYHSFQISVARVLLTEGLKWGQSSSPGEERPEKYLCESLLLSSGLECWRGRGEIALLIICSTGVLKFK